MAELDDDELLLAIYSIHSPHLDIAVTGSVPEPGILNEINHSLHLSVLIHRATMVKLAPVQEKGQL
jgi:hypothetical protein